MQKPQRVVGDDGRDDECHRRVQPVEAPGNEDDRPRAGHPGGGCSVGCGIQQDGTHTQIDVVAVSFEVVNITARMNVPPSMTTAAMPLTIITGRP